MDAPRNLPKKVHTTLGYAVFSRVTYQPLVHGPTESLFVYPTARLAKNAMKGDHTMTAEEVSVFQAILMLLIGTRMTFSKSAFNTLVRESEHLLTTIGVQMDWPACEKRWITFRCETNDRDSLLNTLAPLMKHLNETQQKYLRNN
jgi:hypothetical protein